MVLLVILTKAYFEWKSYRRLAHFYGPTLGKFSNLWMFNVIGRKRTNLELYVVSEKYGTIFSLRLCLIDLVKERIELTSRQAIWQDSRQISS